MLTKLYRERERERESEREKIRFRVVASHAPCLIIEGFFLVRLSISCFILKELQKFRILTRIRLCLRSLYILGTYIGSNCGGDLFKMLENFVLIKNAQKREGLNIAFQRKREIDSMWN